MTLAYVGLVLFILVYFIRPNEWIPGTMYWPLGKIAALIALAGFVPSLLRQPRGVLSLPREMRYLLLLYLQLCLAIPFSIWRGGSFEVVIEGFSKVVLIALCTAMALNSLHRLRTVLFLQTSAMAVLALLTVATGQNRVMVDSAGEERLGGVLGGIFVNPNDLALALVLVLPVDVAFLFRTHNPLLKLSWAAAVVLMIYVVLATLSRGGLLAMMAALGVCLWEFGVKGRRRYLLILAAVGAALVVVTATRQYERRVESIFDLSQDPTGSGWARRTLLSRSILLTLEHPLVGVGPGNFQVLSGFWHGTHNTFTQLSSEAGILAAVLFILILQRSFANLRRVRTLAGHRPEYALLVTALRASLASYLVGGFFLQTAYQFFPYLLLGYVSALNQIAQNSHGELRSTDQACAAWDTHGSVPAFRQRPKAAWPV
jgi:O-antigen ligase